MPLHPEWIIQKENTHHIEDKKPPSSSSIPPVPSIYNTDYKIAGKEIIYKVQFQYHKAGQRRVDLELWGNKLIIGTVGNSGMLKFSFIKELLRNYLPNFLTIYSLIY